MPITIKTVPGTAVAKPVLPKEVQPKPRRNGIEDTLDGRPIGDVWREYRAAPTESMRNKLVEHYVPLVRNVAAEDPEDPSDVSENGWLTWPLEESQVERGVHAIRVQLVKRDPRLTVPLRIEQVEIYLTYRN